MYIISDIVPFDEVLSIYTLFQQIYNLNFLNFLSTIGVVNLGQEKTKSHRGRGPGGGGTLWSSGRVPMWLDMEWCRGGLTWSAPRRLEVVPRWLDLEHAALAQRHKGGAGVVRWR
jgi:hypothetical protein